MSLYMGTRPKIFLSREVKNNNINAMVNPGFPRGGANLLFGQIFPQNSVKMKEIGLRVGALVPPPDPPMKLFSGPLPSS